MTCNVLYVIYMRALRIYLLLEMSQTIHITSYTHLFVYIRTGALLCIHITQESAQYGSLSQKLVTNAHKSASWRENAVAINRKPVHVYYILINIQQNINMYIKPPPSTPPPTAIPIYRYITEPTFFTLIFPLHAYAGLCLCMYIYNVILNFYLTSNQ